MHMPQVPFEGILDLSKQYTNLEVFKAGGNFLMQQAKTSKNDLTGICAYRGCDGLKCAVGAFMPDSFYDPEIEGLSVQLLYDNTESCNQHTLFTQFIGRHLPVLQHLQFIHDNYTPDRWEQQINNHLNWIDKSTGY